MIKRIAAILIVFLVAGATLIGGYFAMCAAFGATPAHAHDIYTGVYGKGGQLCCGGDDCASTTWREHGSNYEFLSREGDWIPVPEDRITFRPIPGDPPANDSHYGHLCYRAASETDRINHPENVFGKIYFYCAFIPPGFT